MSRSGAVTSISEKSRCTYSVSDTAKSASASGYGVTSLGLAPKRVRQLAHRLCGAVEHHFNRILDERVLERNRLADEVLIAEPVGLPSGMLPVHRLEDDLVRFIPVEDERGMVAVRHVSPSSTVSGDAAVEQPSREHGAVHRRSTAPLLTMSVSASGSVSATGRANG